MTEQMGQLLEPREVAEIVITLYDNDSINYQIEGFNGAVAAETAYKMLHVMLKQIAPHVTIPVITQEAQQ